MPPPSCPFCPPPEDRVFHRGELVVGLWDGFPVSPGHALLVPVRHVASWFEATPEELAALALATREARAVLLERHAPEGFNIGVNVGEAGGQTVPHLHVHALWRRTLLGHDAPARREDRELRSLTQDGRGSTRV